MKPRIKPSLAWVLYRAGYGFKDRNQDAWHRSWGIVDEGSSCKNQIANHCYLNLPVAEERILKIKVPHAAVSEILSKCSCGHGGVASGNCELHVCVRKV